MATYSFSTSSNFNIDDNISSINLNVDAQITSPARTNTFSVGNSVNITFTSPLSNVNAKILADIINAIDSGQPFEQSAYFGRYYQYAALEDEVSTTSTSYVTKLLLVTNVVQEGKYRVGFYYEYRSAAVDKFIGVQVVVDNAVIHTLYQIPSNNSYPVSGFAVVPLTNAIHQISLNLLSSDSTVTQYLKCMRLECYNVD